ncbi:MAG TPA: DNA-protecting protein DprA [Candidatus Magasanikbacteria bacterium]|nr:MAG: DNA protecting protein DprA [Candidatus Magasanikbacteria bacterium RIFCSPLOWO2_02_FULL_47_16]OGH80234.1 MAG: DNA protecting protein DprA [Candidatus Magasanikbacteria bacterium RIFCSPHIGHO2_02_FULL_48_18]OGH82132.1 MAG: DNA protecting protein DprA [Candidatus Magasanikbacteria bacterium RIFCSPLOWO2_12_FULL_47_9b]HAZ29062.1 DNA-protecting protein DprA [Candidatus Magasanikbacteria bacterium]
MKKEVLLSYFPKMTVSRYRRIMVAFSTLDHLWDSSTKEMRARLPFEEQIKEEFIAWKNELQEETIESALKESQIDCVTIDDPSYPALLRQIYDPPLCLFVRGMLDTFSRPIAVVGSRQHSPYGKKIAEDFVSVLVQHHCTIVSGLARGIDGIAHEAALHEHGKTTAVLGSGIDPEHIYPSQHCALADRIIDSGGVVLSEYPPGTEPTRYSFPKRNRIISGLSLGVVVIEAGKNSGALVTAQSALEQNREVFAIPQNITSPTSAGTNTLIQMGAHAVIAPQNILEAFSFDIMAREPQAKEKPAPESPLEGILLQYISDAPIHIDELIRQSGAESKTVMSLLALMEMQQKIRDVGGMMYTLY